MKFDVISIDQKVVSHVDLNDSVYASTVRKDILARLVRWQLAKRQAGTHQTKTISMIQGTTKKPYRQKGTGNARQGSLRSPQFRGGATIFGPVVRSHAHKLTKKMRALGLRVALSSKVAEKQFYVVDDLLKAGEKTKQFKDAFGKISGSALIVDISANVEKLRQAGGNLIEYGILPVDGANVYDILSYDTLILSKQAAQKLEERFNEVK